MCVCVCVCVFERVCVLESARERSSIQTNTHTPQTHQPFAAAHARGRTEGESRCNRQSSSRREQYSAHGAPTHKFVFESTHANLKNRFLSQTDAKRDTKKDLMRPSHHSTPKSANEHFLGSSNVRRMLAGFFLKKVVFTYIKQRNTRSGLFFSFSSFLC